MDSRGYSSQRSPGTGNGAGSGEFCLAARLAVCSHGSISTANKQFYAALTFRAGWCGMLRFLIRLKVPLRNRGPGHGDG